MSSSAQARLGTELLVAFFKWIFRAIGRILLWLIFYIKKISKRSSSGILCVVGISMFGCKQPASSPVVENLYDLEVEAYAASLKIAKTGLYAPSTAAFPEYTDHVKYLGDSIFNVNTYIISKDRRGQYVVAAFGGKIKYKGKHEWHSETLKISDDGAEAKNALDNTIDTNKEATGDANAGWDVVASFKGNGRKKSQVFHLTGNEAKIVYTYQSTIQGLGVFAVYVVDKGEDIMRTGGIPELTVDKSKDADESSIQKPEGDYYLDVNAAGRWTVKVMEKQ